MPQKISPYRRAIVAQRNVDSVSLNARTISFAFRTHFELECGYIKRVLGNNQKPPKCGYFLCGECRKLAAGTSVRA